MVSSTAREHRTRIAAQEMRRGRSPPDTARCPPLQATALLPWQRYEQLYAEDAYLTSSLCVQAITTMHLIERYAALDKQLQSLGMGKQRRRLRKQLSLLRLQINEAAVQQRTILVRLSELYVQVHCHDTWGWVHGHGTMWCGYSLQQTAQRCATSMSSLSTTSSHSTALNGASPEFVPAGQLPTRGRPEPFNHGAGDQEPGVAETCFSAQADGEAV
ncbi:hypothetical protein CDD81_2559 [Ophiocordyceps australis]|uniref:Uncharacterized protein n=1 Tax=Ophiocordyceps australis TaxID=1399860 RepID=A0A2C5XXW9_9HYPO|nr:hypothetical protein CDD81_2559 [Ophiocordyceps australis]